VGRLEDEQARQVKVPAHTLERYAGAYVAGPFGAIRIVVHAGELAIEVPAGSARHAAFATSDTDFLVPALGTPLKFFTNAKGEVTHLRLTAVEGDIDASRLPDVSVHRH
jgi:hypothetical protein